MALAGPHPFTTKSGSYYLNVRVPDERSRVVRGRPVTLPIVGESVTVSVTDKVFVSLCTKSAREAKSRFQIALNRLAAYWDSLRAKPVTLTPIEVKALAGETYRNAVRRQEKAQRDGVLASLSLRGALYQRLVEDAGTSHDFHDFLTSLVNAWLSSWRASPVEQLLPGFRDEMGAPSAAEM